MNKYNAVAVKGIFTKVTPAGAVVDLQSNLLSFQRSDGSFSRTLGAGADAAASEQGLRALTALQCAELGVTLYGVR